MDLVLMSILKIVGTIALSSIIISFAALLTWLCIHAYKNMKKSK